MNSIDSKVGEANSIPMGLDYIHLYELLEKDQQLKHGDIIIEVYLVSTMYELSTCLNMAS